MLENKRELIKKIAIVVAVVLVLGIILFVACGNNKGGTKKPGFSQTEHGNTEQEDSTGAQEEWNDFVTENGTESGLTESTETEGLGSEENGAQNGTGNGSGGNTSSGNTTPSRENTHVGLGEESYEYIAQTPSSGSSQEKKLAKEIANKIIKKGMSDFEKVKAINDYIILNVTYDRENYENGTIPYESYTALGAMEKKVAVCAGYAQMFRLVAEAAGLNATYVVGDTPYGYHGWNQVKVDGKWYNIDTTWNDGDYETRESGHFYCGCYEYFLLSNADFEKSHTPHGKVNSTGNSRDFDGIKEGCPYDGKTPYCESQEDITKVVKEMVDSNTMQKRILVKGAKTKEMVEKALSQLKVYAGYTVSESNKTRVYAHSQSGLYRLTINIKLEAASFDEAQKQKINSIQDAKRVCEEKINSFVPSNNNTLDTYLIYVSPALVNNNDFKAELMRWAFYEKKMSLFILDEWKQVDENTYSTRIGLDSAANATSAYEHIYHTKDIEAAVKRMFQYGYKKISLYIQPSDYKLTGGFNEAGYAFENTFCKPLNEKYCLRSDWDQVHPEQNEISVYFSAEGHDVEYVDWEVQKEATCVSEGLQVKYCTICHAVAEQQAIPKNANHDYYWATNGSNRTRKCHSCSYTGISEVCIGGVWGYFDDAKAQQAMQSVNALRAQHTIWDTDPFGSVIGSRKPDPLIVSNDLIIKAKNRLAVIAALDRNNIWSSAQADEYIRKTFQHRHDPKHTEVVWGGISDNDMVKETYGSIGAVCFYWDFKDDGSWMMPIYVIEFGPAN